MTTPNDFDDIDLLGDDLSLDDDSVGGCLDGDMLITDDLLREDGDLHPWNEC
jgi:hypothetical protein